MSVRVAHRRAYNNIWTSKNKKSSKSNTNGTTSTKSSKNDEDKPISYFRKKAARQTSSQAKNHPSYGRNRDASTSSQGSNDSHGNGKQTRRAKYYVSKNNKIAYGSSKKGGAGGAYTWGTPGDELNIPDLDPNDPNYDSEADADYFDEEELRAMYTSGTPSALSNASQSGNASYLSQRPQVEKPRMSLSQFKKQIIDILAEFFISEDTAEVGFGLEQVNTPLFHWEFVKRTITMAMDRKERSREAACRLLAYLHADGVLTTNDVGQGFERLFEYMDDLESDVPFCKRYLAQFLARAVADEILPPAFLNDSYVQAYGAEVVEESRTLLSRKHGVARVEKVWGPGDGRPVSELKKEVTMLLLEFLNCRVKAEAAHCLRSLNSPHFHHEFIKRAVVIAMDLKDEEREAILELCVYLFNEQILTQGQVTSGVKRLELALPDLRLDSPNATSVLEWFKASFKNNEMI